MNAEYFLDRGKELVRLLKSRKVHSFLSKNPSLIFHLTGLHETPGYLLVLNGEVRFVTDRRFQKEAAEIKHFISSDIFTNSIVTYLKPLRKEFKQPAIEYGRVTHAEYLSLSESLKCTFTDAGDAVNQFLSVTDGLQLDSFIRAADVTSELFNYCKKVFDENLAITEKELAYELQSILVRNAAQKYSFEPIIAADENSAKPHHTPSDRNIQDCKVLLVDLGVIYSGICSDVTRTYIRNHPKAGRIEKIVHNGFKRVLGKVNAGVKVSELAQMWKAELEKVNMTHNFTHALGHGLGYEVHQIPRISEYSKETLKENQIITLEPALYFENEFGYRYECDILVTKDSGINLTVF
ncbi:MAG: aminopeptidase P family protein [Ignavibacteriales bacterium]|nr:MAG: aminopeptidase P family protein [Ignavibacteriales bacterium]